MLHSLFVWNELSSEIWVFGAHRTCLKVLKSSEALASSKLVAVALCMFLLSWFFCYLFFWFIDFVYMYIYLSTLSVFFFFFLICVFSLFCFLLSLILLTYLFNLFIISLVLFPTWICCRIFIVMELEFFTSTFLLGFVYLGLSWSKFLLYNA